MIGNVPMIPFVVVTGISLWLGMMALLVVHWSLSIFIGIVYSVAFVSMVIVTKKDDQRIAQIFLKMRVRLRCGRAKSIWGAQSYSPMKYGDLDERS